MSNYTKTTNFAVKDALITGDINKIVRGTEIDLEFTNLQVSSATKADLISPALTSVPTAPTAAAGTDTTQLATTAFVNAELPLMKFFIYGLIQLNSVGDTVNDISISPGGAMDASAVSLMILPTAIIKQLDVNWVVGTNQGGLDTGAVANGDYYIWLIKRPDTGVVDVLYSLSSTAPTMPASYTLKRLIGWFRRTVGAGGIAQFNCYEDAGGGLHYLLNNSSSGDISLSNTLTTAARTDTLAGTPKNFSVLAICQANAQDVSAFYVLVSCPDTADFGPSLFTAQLAGVAGGRSSAQFEVRTSATGTVRSRADVATIDQYGLCAVGFHWARRN